MIIERPLCLYYIDIDKPINQTPILFLHGFTSNHHSWDDIRELINIPSLAIDLPGHGQSIFQNTSNEFSFTDWCNDLKSILDQLQLKKIHLCGYSMGGRLALAFAIQNPNYIQSLILESASPGIDSQQERVIRKTEDLKLAELIEEDYKEFINGWQKKALFSQQKQRNKKGWERQQSLRFSQSPHQLSASLKYLGTGVMSSLWGHLENFHFEVLIPTGVEDQKFCDIAFEMKNRFPKATHYKMNGSGHHIHLEQPEKYYKVLTTFLKKHLTF